MVPCIGERRSLASVLPTSFPRGLPARETIADPLRQEALASGPCPRHLLLARVASTLGLHGDAAASLDQALSSLEALGEVTAGDGGLIAPAPLLAVELPGQRFALLGSVPTPRLEQALGCGLVGELPRCTPPGLSRQAVEQAVVRFAGRVLSLSRWAGLDREPTAAEWLGELRGGQALEGRDVEGLEGWGGVQALSPEGAAQSPPRAWKAGALGEKGWLVRGVLPGGSKRTGWAWGEGGRQVVAGLTADEGRRASFGLCAEAGVAARVRREAGEGGRVRLSLSLPLPRAEYRALRLSEAAGAESQPGTMTFDETAVGEVCELLRSRLGVIVDG